jgi:hypothetical protein
MNTQFDLGRRHVLNGVGEPTGDYSYLISLTNLLFFSGGREVEKQGLDEDARYAFYQGMTEASKELGVIERRSV